MTSGSTTHPTASDLEDIQGNLIGFNKDHQRLLFVGFGDSRPVGQAFVGAMTHEANNGKEVRDFNAAYKARAKAGEDQLSDEVSWVNVALNSPGLRLLAPDDFAVFPPDFTAGMRARAAENGDVDTSDPERWEGAFAPGAATVDALIIVAAGTPDLLEQRTAAVRAALTAAGATEVANSIDGKTRPGEQAGHEHFGFKDGISQPSILGLTTSSKGGADIAAGEFLIGWPTQDGTISGEALPEQPTSPSDPGYPNPTPSPQPAPLPTWAKNGSFLVFRQLRQDVVGFHSFADSNASAVQMTAARLEAKFVGRWPDGAPLERVPGEPRDLDPATTDPKDADPTVLLDDHINNFNYAQHDADGHAVPQAAHIRKAYPRDEQPPGAQEANRHRILRRGIPYGPEVTPTESPYDSGQVGDGKDRGLLFLCYQSSITRGFEFIQRSWANNIDFPETGSGQDPIIDQAVAAPSFPLPANPHFTTQRWVTTVGGDYFFAPSISALRILAGSTEPA